MIRYLDENRLRKGGVVADRTQRLCCLLAGMVIFGTVGCGGGDDFQPELGVVKGIIKINGAPASDLIVTFEPQAKDGAKRSMVGNTSSATTDTQGHFELEYAEGGAKGAVVGSHVVRIASAAGGGLAGGEKAIAMVSIPEKYNTASILKANVLPGETPPLEFQLEISKR